MATATTPLTEKEEQRVIIPPQEWSDAYALKVAVQDFQAAAAARHSNHEGRWARADQIYKAYSAQKVWPGTRIPRANIPVYMAFKMVESLMPRFMDIFADYPWADIDPEYGVQPMAARRHRDLVIWQFDQKGPKGEPGGREHMRRAFKAKLIFGNGIIEAGWKSYTKTRKKWVPYFYRQTRNVFDPMMGMVPTPIGPVKRKVQKIEEAERINRPFARYTSLRDFYIDDNCESPSVQDARFACKRCLVWIDELEQYRNQPDFDIPANDELVKLSMKTSQSQGDAAKQQSEAMRGVTWNPTEATTVDPAGKRLELVTYYTADRVVWVLNQEVAIYNEPNSYGIIPFFNTVYADVLDRFYGLAITDVVEGDQQLSREMIEARIDEAALGIHRGMTKRRGLAIPQSQLRRRPGITREADNPREDIIHDDILNVSQQFYAEVSLSDLRAQATTGITDQSVTGAAPVQGNAALRTATGANIQAGATGKRHTYSVENDEYSFVEPVLNFFADMNVRFLDPETKVRWGMEEAEGFEIMNSPVRFKLRAGTRARAKTSLLQALPVMQQGLLNPAFLTMLAQQQSKTVDVEELADMLMDAVDYRPRGAFFRDMTPEEQQKMNQPAAEETLRMQMQRERLESVSENQSEKSQAELIKEIVKQTLAMQREEQKALNEPEPRS